MKAIGNLALSTVSLVIALGNAYSGDIYWAITFVCLGAYCFYDYQKFKHEGE